MTFAEYLTQSRKFLAELFSLEQDKANETETVMMIQKGVEFKGINVWILIFAIMVASVGLNVNSPAVVIGAMLISPLMGPIMGVGLSLGIYDFDLFKKSLKNLSVMIIVSILSSAIYFALSPIENPQSELIARTTPSLYDVLIAFFGGLAGIVAGSSKEKGNVVPGVAIATALMPPLCTAGYGLAHGSGKFFFGGGYLFLINTIFISLTTYLIVRMLGYKKKEIIDPVKEKRVNMLIPVIALLTIIPSIYLAINLVRENSENINLNKFLIEEMNSPSYRIVSTEIVEGIEGARDTFVVYLLGESLSPEMKHELQEDLVKYQPNYVLNIRQDLIPEQKLDINTLRQDLLSDLYKNNEQIIQNKNAKIALLEQAISNIKNQDAKIDNVFKGIKYVNPNVSSVGVKEMPVLDIKNNKIDTIHIAYVGITKALKSSETEEIRGFIKDQLECDSLKVVLLKE